MSSYATSSDPMDDSTYTENFVWICQLVNELLNIGHILTLIATVCSGARVNQIRLQNIESLADLPMSELELREKKTLCCLSQDEAIGTQT